MALERPRHRARAGAPATGRPSGSAWPPTTTEPAPGCDEHGRELAAERLGRRLRSGVVGLRQRQRLAEQRGDAVEAALHARLPRALAEALGVAERERRERREGLEQLDVGVRERARRVAHPDAEDAARLAGPDHRRDERAREPVVRRGAGRR